MSESFNPSDPGALRVLHQDRWQLEQDFAQPTLDMLASGRNLRKFTAEETQNYDYRIYNSTPLDMIPDALALRIDNIFRVEPVRTFADNSPHRALIEQLIRDADNEGTTLTAFMRRALWLRNSMGADIVTQMSSAPTLADGTPMPTETEADAAEAGLRPFFLLFSPLQKVDWATGGSGHYDWIRFALGDVPPPDEQSAPPGIRKFLSLTPTTWTVWSQKLDENGKPEADQVTGETGDHPADLGIVPVTKLYFQESMVAGEGGVSIALISRAAVLARYLLNLKSQADMDLLASVVRWILSGYSGKDAPTALGPMTVWVSDNTEAKLTAVNGGVAQIVEKRNWVMLIVMEILRLLKFRGGMGDTEGNQGSGVKLALEMTDLRNELLATAEQMETAEVEMMRQAAILATGKDVKAEDLGLTVLYNKDFVLDSATELLDQMKKWVVDLDEIAAQMPTLTKAMVGRLTSSYIRQDSPAAAEVVAEIEALAPRDESAEEGGQD